MWHTISSYALTWSVGEGFGGIRITTDGRYDEHLKMTSAEEMMVLVDILRNEHPVHFNVDTKAIATGDEPPGEGE